MAKPSKHPPLQRMLIARPGEGEPIALVSTITKDRAGNSVQILQGDMSGARVPDRKYSGEVADVVWHRGMVRLMFAQEKADLVSLRSLLVVYLGPATIRAFLKSLSELDGATLEQLAAASHVTPAPLAKIVEEPQQTIGLRANNIVMATASGDTCLDFYQASAFAIRAGKHTGKLPIDPIVRVEISLALFLSIVERLKALTKEFPETSDLDI